MKKQGRTLKFGIVAILVASLVYFFIPLPVHSQGDFKLSKFEQGQMEKTYNNIWGEDIPEGVEFLYYDGHDGFDGTSPRYYVLQKVGEVPEDSVLNLDHFVPYQEPENYNGSDESVMRVPGINEHGDYNPQDWTSHLFNRVSDNQVITYDPNTSCYYLYYASK